MSELETREKRLLRTMLTMLDTLENEAELVNTVHGIRNLMGPGFFSTVLPAVAYSELHDVSLQHSDRAIALRIRSLGIMLRLASHPHPEIHGALIRAREAMIHGGEVSRLDLLVTMACLTDLIEREAERRLSPGGSRPPPRTAFPIDNPGVDVRETMELLSGILRGE